MTMTPREQHRAIRNLVHNDCGISKAEIKELVTIHIDRIIREQIEAMFKNQGTNFKEIVDRYIRNAVESAYYGVSKEWYRRPNLQNTIREQVADEIAKVMLNQFEFVIKVKEGE
jgi:hypothetical protein